MIARSIRNMNKLVYVHRYGGGRKYQKVRFWKGKYKKYAKCWFLPGWPSGRYKLFIINPTPQKLHPATFGMKCGRREVQFEPEERHRHQVRTCLIKCMFYCDLSSEGTFLGFGQMIPNKRIQDIQEGHYWRSKIFLLPVIWILVLLSCINLYLLKFYCIVIYVYGPRSDIKSTYIRVPCFEWNLVLSKIFVATGPWGE